jgi:hypothetical protein
MKTPAQEAIKEPVKSGWPARLILAWMFVGIPLLWGVFQTLIKALALFY